MPVGSGCEHQPAVRTQFGARCHSRVAMQFEPQREADQQDAEYGRIGADCPNETERTGSRRHQHNDPEDHRHSAGEDQPPFVVDFLVGGKKSKQGF